MTAREYVRLTFRPAEAKRRRTTWAVVVSRKAGRVVYNECTEDGETTYDGGMKDGVQVEQIRMIVATPSEVSELPARMNNKYAALEVVPCDFCQERPPVPGLPWCQRCARKGRS